MVPMYQTGVIRTSPRHGYDGWQIRIEDDGGNGFLILFSRDFSNRDAEAYDEWAGTEDDLTFRLHQFEINWNPTNP
jgi:hypothetical protein